MTDSKMPELCDVEKIPAFDGVPIEISVAVGKARPTIKELMALRSNDVLVLNTQIDDEVDLFVGDRLIGKGQLEEITEGNEIGRLAVRFTQLFDIRTAQS